MLAGQSGVVERRTVFDTIGQIVARLGIRDTTDLLGELPQFRFLVAIEPTPNHATLSFGCRLGVPPGVDEHQRRPALVEGVVDQCLGLPLAPFDGHLPLAPVVEVDRVAEVDPHPEVDRSPLRVDQLGVEPVGYFVGVADGCRQRDDLQAGVDLPEFGEGHFECRPTISVVDQMHLVGDDTGELVDPARVVPNEGVDLLARGDDNIPTRQPLLAGVVVAGRNPDRNPVLLPALELGFLLAGQRAQRDDIEGLAAAFDGRQHGQLSDKGLSTCGRH